MGDVRVGVGDVRVGVGISMQSKMKALFFMRVESNYVCYMYITSSLLLVYRATCTCTAYICMYIIMCIYNTLYTHITALFFLFQ